MVITKGDTHNFIVTVKDSSSGVFDLTSYDMKFIAKYDPSKDDDDADILCYATIIDPTLGVGSFKLLPTDTNIKDQDYYYDVQISDGLDNVYTVIKNSKLRIVKGIAIDS